MPSHLIPDEPETPNHAPQRLTDFAQLLPRLRIERPIVTRQLFACGNVAERDDDVGRS